MKESPPHKRFFSRMQLTLHATRPPPQGASSLVQANVCPIDETDLFRPGIVGMRKSMVVFMHDYGHA